MGRKKNRRNRNEDDDDDDFVDPLANIDRSADYEEKPKASNNNSNSRKKGGRRRGKNKKKQQPVEEVKAVESDEEEEEDGIITERDFPLYVRLIPSNGWFSEKSKQKLLSQRDIIVPEFSVSVPGQKLIDPPCPVKLIAGNKYGVVGRNGLGKSVFVKEIAYRRVPMPEDMTVLMVEQEIAGSEMTPLETVISADKEREWLVAEAKKLEEEEKSEVDLNIRRSYNLRDIYDRMKEIEADKAEPRAMKILSGLGFSIKEARNKKSNEFSGGWRMRIALAQALFCSPDLLILDEPTNHLDLHANFWLEEYLMEWKKMLLLVSHEREFINSTCNNIIHVHQQKLHFYKGDYDNFVKVRGQRQRELKSKADKQNRKVKKTQNYIHKNISKGKGVKERKRELEKMKMVKLDVDDKRLVFDFPAPEEIGPHLIKFREVDFAYPGEKNIFTGLDFGIFLDDRLALVGPNGVGKSTLMNLMSGNLKETKGYVDRHTKLRIARFTQHHVDQLSMDISPVEYMQKKFSGATIQEIRKHLGRFGLSGDLALKSIAKLSGGQKSRVVFAELGWAQPHLMLLDEPSNHLDMETIDSLINALEEFEGAVVIISHNQTLISGACNQLLVLHGDNTVTKYEGDFEDYKEEVLSELDL